MRKKITIWERLHPDEYGNYYEHNHIEDGWVDDDKPVGNEEQTKSWANHSWRKKFGYLDDGHVVYLSRGEKHYWRGEEKSPHVKNIKEWQTECAERLEFILRAGFNEIAAETFNYGYDEDVPEFDSKTAAKDVLPHVLIAARMNGIPVWDPEADSYEF